MSQNNTIASLSSTSDLFAQSTFVLPSITQDLTIDLTKRLYDKEYGVDNGDRLYIYNKGGFFTREDPLRKVLLTRIHSYTHTLIHSSHSHLHYTSITYRFHYR